MFVAARDPEAVGRWAYKLEHLLPGKLTHRLAGALLRFAEGLAVVRTPKRLALALLLSFPLWLSIGLGIWAVTRAFGIDMPFTGSFLLIALLIVGVSVPTPGNVGGFEAAVQIGLTSFYAVPNDRAVGAALVLHAVSLLPTIALGLSVRAAGRPWIRRHAQSRARGGGTVKPERRGAMGPRKRCGEERGGGPPRLI